MSDCSEEEKKRMKAEILEEVKNAFIKVNDNDYAMFSLCFIKEFIDEMKV